MGRKADRAIDEALSKYWDLAMQSNPEYKHSRLLPLPLADLRQLLAIYCLVTEDPVAREFWLHAYYKLAFFRDDVDPEGLDPASPFLTQRQHEMLRTIHVGTAAALAALRSTLEHCEAEAKKNGLTTYDCRKVEPAWVGPLAMYSRGTPQEFSGWDRPWLYYIPPLLIAAAAVALLRC